MEKKNGGNHLRVTLALLIANQGHECVQLEKMMSKIKHGSPILAKNLYERMLIRCLSNPSSYDYAQIWMPKDSFGKLGTKEKFRNWLVSNEYQNDMNSEDLLSYGAITGWHAAWRFLLREDLVHVTRANKVKLNYPINEQLYSLEYASVMIRSLLKKNVEVEVGLKTSLDINTDNSILSSDVYPTQRPFWEQ
jgi:hypothetical protein